MTRGKILMAIGGLGLGAVLALMVSRAGAAPACGHHPCSDEVAATCAATNQCSGKARAACFKSVVAACKNNACSCGGSASVTGDCACASPSGAFLDGVD